MTISCYPELQNKTRERSIFELIGDNRTTRRKVVSACAGTAVNALLLATFAILWQVSALRHASELLASGLREELGQYRILLVAPTAIPRPASEARTTKADSGPAPLEAPDPRILRALDGAIVDFVGENPEIENIITREIVRDLDSKTLDLRSLFEKSDMQISFGLDETGKILWRRVDVSSQVPSIDHLVLELAQLLEKYGFLRMIGGLERVTASIRIDQRIEITMEAGTSPQADIGMVRGQIEAGLVLWRMFLSEEDVPLLQDVTIETGERQVKLSKTFEKDRILKLLNQYYRPVSPK